jgi:hypothetical protein
MRRSSIRTLMAFVLVSAVGLAALRNASNLWAGMMLLVALAAVGIAVLGAVILRGKERYGWAGFAFFGGGYLALAVGPWLGDTFQPQLGTTHLLSYVHSQVTATSSVLNAMKVQQIYLGSVTLKADALPDQSQVSTNPASTSFTDYASDPNISPPPVNRWRSLLPGAANFDQFQRVGHSLFALLAGLLGAVVAGWFYARRELVLPHREAV